MSDGQGEVVAALPAVVRSNNGRFLPGHSPNPGGRPKNGERWYLAKMYGEDGRKVFKRLEALRNDPETPRRLQAQIDMFLIERQFGKAAQLLGVEGGPSLVQLLETMTAQLPAPAVDCT